MCADALQAWESNMAGSIATENKIARAENELMPMLKAHEVVAQAKLQVEREIIDLQAKKKDLTIALSQSSSSIKQKNLEIKMLTRQFWAEKNSGL